MKQYTLSKADLLSLGKGLLIAVAGAVLTYAAAEIKLVNFGENTPLVTAVAGVLFNVAWKVLDGVRA